DIKPVLSLKSRIIDIHFLDIGEGVSYDHTFITRRPSIIATLGIGYGDGYMRNLSNRAWVIIKGKKVPIVGRICMNHILIDITDVPDVKLYETVTLIGKEGEEEITATELAIKSGTINYEITTKLLPHIERIVVE
ncbi:MAG: alanine racemase, partial [Candidatus Hydrothermae bacterium]|nr:alanine racemase [Candidatus Hydrothermae bacterium]